MYDGTVLFREECDGYYGASLSRGDAIKALLEAIDYIQSYDTEY
jgi:hypothetical protein